MNEVISHLGLELGEEFVILSSRKKFIYSVDNMIQLEETFQKVCASLLMRGEPHKL